MTINAAFAVEIGFGELRAVDLILAKQGDIAGLSDGNSNRDSVAGCRAAGCGGGNSSAAGCGGGRRGGGAGWGGTSGGLAAGGQQSNAKYEGPGASSSASHKLP